METYTKHPIYRSAAYLDDRDSSMPVVHIAFVDFDRKCLYSYTYRQDSADEPMSASAGPFEPALKKDASLLNALSYLCSKEHDYQERGWRLMQGDPAQFLTLPFNLRAATPARLALGEENAKITMEIKTPVKTVAKLRIRN